MARLYKKVAFLGLILFLVTIFSCWTIYDAYAQEWVIANQSTISWDAVTTLSNGAPIPENDLIEYTVYLSNAVADPDKSNPIEVGSVNGTEYTIIMSTEGKYFVGLKTVRKLADGTNIGESVIGWSDDPVIVVDGHTFGLQYFLPPALITGLKPGI